MASELGQYAELLAQYREILTGRWITDLANTSAFLYTEVGQMNWTGFYLLENGQLILGPFQGKVACTEIKIGRGVCGQAAAQRQSLLVPDVEKFSDHITCDPSSRSELVVPLLHKNDLLGVLDADSQQLNRFSETEKSFFEAVVQVLLQKNFS